MRPIKFRAWHKTKTKGNKMLDWNDILHQPDFGHTLNGYYHNAIIMQYTGLTDRNGKEIYEGDILKCTDDADNFVSNGAVEWLHDFWNVSEVEDSLYQIQQCGYVEVIGNIHANPELLEVGEG